MLILAQKQMTNYPIFLFVAWVAMVFCITSCQPNQSSDMEAFTEKFITPFERDSNYTPTHNEVIAYYEELAKAFPKQLQFKVGGTTDVGRPLHIGVLALDGRFAPADYQNDTEKCILLINNAIHPGEPTGVDATMMLIRDILTQPALQKQMQHTVIVFIPMYNVGGALNRGSYSRANQEGPEAYGFRGNARNFDLNRDFIKCDTRNAQSFNQLFTQWRPHIFIDNHTSNGADYQYVMTLIPTHPDKLPPVLANYMTHQLLPELYDRMATANYELTPYVYSLKATPDDGIMGFMDLPRYSSGYAALFNCLSFMPEAHMLKPYRQRVRGTYAFMAAMLDWMAKDYDNIIQNKKAADERTAQQDTFALNWALNMESIDSFAFKGYEAKYKTSEVSGLERLYYGRNAPYTRSIPFYNAYDATVQVQKPKAYLIPQAYTKVIERLQWNGVAMQPLEADTLLNVMAYYIEDYTTRSAYEGHYLHSKVEVREAAMQVQGYKGDYLVYTNQATNNYIVHTLEPRSADAFFAWNFFDAILQQKEYFSAYVFEDVAAQLLKDNADLRQQLADKKAEDPDFAKNANAQLRFIYKNSPYYEATHKRYPIFRLSYEL